MLDHFYVIAHTPKTAEGWLLLKHNCLALAGRLKAAYTWAEGNLPVLGDEVKIIFLAPEWYFRKKEPEKSKSYYTAKELGEIINFLIEQSRQYPEMLLVPGSILWAMPEHDAPKPIKKKRTWFGKAKEPEISAPIPALPPEPKGYIVYNTVVVLHGGNIVHICHKSREGLDIDRDANLAFGFEDSIKGEDGKSWQEICRERSKAGKQTLTNLFSFAGREFGIEICADHGSGIMKQEYDELYPDGDGVDVQIVISCGMAVNLHGVAAREGGYILHCDGSLDGDANKKRGSFVSRVKKYLPPQALHPVELDPQKKDYNTLKRKYITVLPVHKRIVVYEDLYSL